MACVGAGCEAGCGYAFGAFRNVWRVFELLVAVVVVVLEGGGVMAVLLCVAWRYEARCGCGYWCIRDCVTCIGAGGAGGVGCGGVGGSAVVVVVAAASVAVSVCLFRHFNASTTCGPCPQTCSTLCL